MKAKKEETEEDLKNITEKHSKAIEARKASDAKLAELHNKSINLRGGRSLAMQSQIDAEIAKNQQLADEEKKLETEKAKAKKKVEKEESRSKRIAAQKRIVEGAIDIASGVLKAWALGPVVGPILWLQ